MPEFVHKYAENPLIIVAVIGFIFLLGFVAARLLSRRSRYDKRERESQVSNKLAALGHERFFTLAVEQLRYEKTPSAAASRVAAIFKEGLSSSVLAVYAAKDGASELIDILASISSESGSAEASATALPNRVPASLLNEPWQPQFVPLSALVAPPTDTSPSGESTENGAPAPAARSESERSDSRDRTLPLADQGPGSAVLLPWRGPFDWVGLIVASSGPKLGAKALQHFREPVARLGQMIAVALEIDTDQAAARTMESEALGVVALARGVINALDDPSPLEGIARETALLVGGDSAAIWRIDRTASIANCVASSGMKTGEPLPLPLGQGFAGTIAVTGEMLSLRDAPEDPRCLFPREAREAGVGSYLGVPIVSEGAVAGVIEVHTRDRKDWSAREKRTLELAADLIGRIFKNVDSRGNTLKVESAYLRLAESFERLRSPEEILDAAVEVLGHALGVSRAVVIELEGEGDARAVQHEYRVAGVSAAVELTLREGAASRVRDTRGGPIQIGDSNRESLMTAESVARLGVKSELGAGIELAGRSAVLYLHQCDRHREWQIDELEFAERVARQVSACLANARALSDLTARADGAAERAKAAESAAQEIRRTLESVESGIRERAAELQNRVSAMEQQLIDARTAESAARTEASLGREETERLRSQAVTARNDAEAAGRMSSQLEEDVTRLKEDEERSRKSAQQLLEVNRLKSEFIVNVGHELESSLQSVVGFADMLAGGSYGPLTAEQMEAIHGLRGWAGQLRNDVDLLIEYGSRRSRRLDAGEGTNPT
jgi:GAF domain-containing protein